MIKQHKNSKKTALSVNQYQLLLLALPAMLLLLVFCYLPMAGIIIAFKDLNYVDGIFKSPWVGLKNFSFLITSKDAFLAVRNTLLYNSAFIVLGTIISVVFAILMNELASRSALKFYQTAFFFPYFFSWVIVAYMLYSFMAEPYGIVSHLFKSFGMKDFAFYTTTSYWPFILILVGLWKGIGYTSVIYYAGILGISGEYFEAAAIDGATRFQVITKIMLPFLYPLIIIMTLLSVGKIFYADFGLFFFVPREIGTLFPVTQVLDTFVYRALRTNGDVGMASASGLFQSVLGFVTVLFSNLLVRRISPENSLF